MGSFLPNPSWWVSSRRVPGSCWTGVQRICWNRKRKRNMRNMHGGGFPNATYWVCTQTGTDADLFKPLSPAAHRLIRPTGFSQRQSATGGAGASGERPIRSPGSATGEGSTTHHNLYPQFGVQSRNVNSSTFCLCPFTLAVTVDRGLQGTCTQR